MIREFAQRMMDAEVEVRCRVREGEPGAGELRNGYRRRERDTRAGTIELTIPKLRSGSYFPSFLEHRGLAERALTSVVATSYVLGVWTRRVEKLAASLGVVGLSKSRVSTMAAELDELVEVPVRAAGPQALQAVGACRSVRQIGKELYHTAIIFGVFTKALS